MLMYVFGVKVNESTIETETSYPFINGIIRFDPIRAQAEYMLEAEYVADICKVFEEVLNIHILYTDVLITAISIGDEYKMLV